MNFRCCTALLMLWAVAPALAHNQLPMIQACEGSKPVYLGSFGYEKKALRDYHVCLVRYGMATPRLAGTGGGGGGTGPGPDPVCIIDDRPLEMVRCPAQTCGDFDDDYSTARALALAACSSLVGEGTDFPDGGLVVPVFDGPSSFLGTTHHADYTINQGIYGQCALCPGQLD